MIENFNLHNSVNDDGAGIYFDMKKVKIHESDGVVVSSPVPFNATCGGGILASVRLEKSFSIYDSVQLYTGVMGYVSCEGLLDKGKRKNVYTETYADSDRLRIHQDPTNAREATIVTFKFAFTGKDRRTVYENFYKYLVSSRFYTLPPRSSNYDNCVIEYYDNARKKYAYLVLIDAVSPEEDVWTGSERYIVCEFKFQNLFGTTFDSPLSEPTE